MRLRWSIPLPGPLSVGGSMRLTGGGGRSRRGGTGGALTGLLKVCAYVLIAEAWAAWWSLKLWYVLGVLVHRQVTGQPTVIWRSRGGWW